MATDEALRRWTPIVARIKTRLAVRNSSTPPKLEAALDEAAATFDELLQELAGAETANRNLRSSVTRLENEWDDLFQSMPVACVLTDASGTIRRANDRAADLLNTSARHLQRENAPLTYFVHDRQPFFALLKALPTAGEVQATLLIRPRERALVMIDVRAVARPADDESLWLWFLVPASAQPTESRKVMSADVRGIGGDGLVAESSSARADLVDEAS
jgi:PAS domain-containing protein